MASARKSLRAVQSLQRLALVVTKHLPGAPPAPAPGRIVEVARFGSNPGELRMFVRQPAGAPRTGAPLIIVLHGCGQGAAAFATDSGWVDLATALHIPLVMPEQKSANNPNRCFNWYRPADVGRGLGEAMSIRQMITTAVRRFGSDRRRIFVVGLSAGGAMAAAMLAAYPAVFAGGAIVAGMPIGAASTSPMALLRMHRADPFRTREGLAAEVRVRAPGRGKRAWPRVSIWQGGRDRTVDPVNAELLAAQWSAVHAVAAEPATDTLVSAGVRRRIWGRPAKPAVELWTIAELAHGFPIDGETGLGRAGLWVVEAHLPAVERIAAFWGLLTDPSGHLLALTRSGGHPEA